MVEHAIHAVGHAVHAVEYAIHTIRLAVHAIRHAIHAISNAIHRMDRMPDRMPIRMAMRMAKPVALMGTEEKSRTEGTLPSALATARHDHVVKGATGHAIRHAIHAVGHAATGHAIRHAIHAVGYAVLPHAQHAGPHGDSHGDAHGQASCPHGNRREENSIQKGHYPALWLSWSSFERPTRKNFKCSSYVNKNAVTR